MKTFISIILLLLAPFPALATSITSHVIFDQINSERIAAGQTALSISPHLSRAAELKAEDMVSRGYFAHYNTNKQGIRYFLGRVEYDYLSAGENLAMGFQTSEGVVRAWMRSRWHRENILDPGYEETGIAVMKSNIKGKETIIIVQLFARTTNYELSR